MKGNVMAWARRLWLKLQTLVHRQRISQGLDDEIQFTWGWIRLEQIGQDLRYGARTLLENPGFTS